MAPQPDRSQPMGSSTQILLSFAPFFQPYRKRILFWFLIYGMYFLLGILTPLSVKIYFDSILPSHSLAAIWTFITAYAFYAFGYHLLYFVGSQGTVYIIETVVSDLRMAVYDKVHRLTIRYFDKNLSGEIVNKVTNDTRQILSLVGNELVTVILQSCMGVVSLVILLVWNWQLGVVVLAFTPVYAWLFRGFMPLVHKAARQWRRIEDRLWGNWGEKLRGMSVIQAFTRERSEALKHYTLGHISADRWYRMVMMGTTMNVLGGFTSNISNHSVFAVGCLFVTTGHLRIGEVISLSALVGYILTPLQTVFNLMNTWQQSAVSAERIQKMLREVEEARTTEGRRQVGRLQGEIRFSHVTFEYEKGHPVLHDIDFEVTPGQNIALVGHTGCGKSTIVHLLQDFYRPQSGSILLDGISIHQMDPQDLRRNIGIVPQDVILFKDTVRANIAYGRQEATDEELWAVLKVAQVDDYVRRLTRGLDTRLGGEEGIEPSQGEAQRLSIARALLTDPSIVVLDEATSSLDSEEELRVQKAIKVLLKKRTAIIIAHRLSTIRQCDQIIVLEAGRIMERGKPSRLAAQPDSIYAQLVRAHYFGGKKPEGQP